MSIGDIFRRKPSVPTVAFDPETQIPVIRASICNGEKVAGFRTRQGDRFTEIMCIRSQKDLETFRSLCGGAEIRTEY